MTTFARNDATDAHEAAREPARWTTSDAESMFGIDMWGNGYIATNDAGHVSIRPTQQPGIEIDLHNVIAGLDSRDILTPVVVRFPDMVKHRLGAIKGAFDAAIAEAEYAGTYRSIFPIKVNQQRVVVEEIQTFGREHGVGLEAGSKPELLAVLAMTSDAKAGAGEAPTQIICNGFKDREYIETVILAQKLGRSIIPVVERFAELQLIIETAKQYGVTPTIGVRMKPSAASSGQWASSSGYRSKFGLTSAEILRALEVLEGEGMADCLKMLHFHIGSQMCEIRGLKAALGELAHTYTELRRLGAGLEIVDVGGGLGVDYDGSRSAWSSSMNYTIEEYASDVVWRIKDACDAAGQPHPHIYSESGRAMVAYSSVLVMDVLGINHFASNPDMDKIRAAIEREDELASPIEDLLDAYERACALDGTGRPVEVYHDAALAKQEALSLYKLGYLSLPMRAAAERLFWAVGRRILAQFPDIDELHEELSTLPEELSDIYFCNFSLFQSLPDSWAIHQVFPVCPIHRLDEKPTRRGVIADVSCDSDGKIDRFATQDTRDFAPTLPLHELKKGETYYLGIFLVGAYQEVLGDLHNLFGDTHVVHVSHDPDSADGWAIEEYVEGDTVREVLEYVEYDTDELRRTMRRDVERAVRKGRLRVEEGKALMKFYIEGLEGYTYLE